MKRLLAVIALLLWSGAAASAQASGWQSVEEVFGRKGTVQGDMLKVTFPRTDLAVKVGILQVEPGLALTSWIGFKQIGKSAMMMGDLALLEGEVAPVMTRLLAEGVEVTALHNHLIGTTPVVMYLHFGGEGEPTRLARAMRTALSASATPLGPVATEASPPPSPDWGKVETILGKTGQKNGNLLQIGFPRKEKITEKGMEIPPFLGVATGLNFQMAGDSAAATGDFVLIGSEVNRVVRALLGHGIKVTAIHSHMLFESPRLFFLHFWGYDKPEILARGLKAALDETDSAR